MLTSEARRARAELLTTSRSSGRKRRRIGGEGQRTEASFWERRGLRAEQGADGEPRARARGRPLGRDRRRKDSNGAVRGEGSLHGPGGAGWGGPRRRACEAC